MAALQHVMHETPNPLDRVEKIAEARAWALDRTGTDEAVMLVTGTWSDLQVSLNWREELETLHLACSFDAKVPATRRDEMMRLLARINEQLLHGHFDLWRQDGSLVFRNALVLAGGAQANDAQCEALIRLAVETCQRYYPAVQFVAWAGLEAGAAMDNSLFETMGEA
jgi:hypothetical protein